MELMSESEVKKFLADISRVYYEKHGNWLKITKDYIESKDTFILIKSITSVRIRGSIYIISDGIEYNFSFHKNEEEIAHKYYTQLLDILKSKPVVQSDLLDI